MDEFKKFIQECFGKEAKKTEEEIDNEELVSDNKEERMCGKVKNLAFDKSRFKVI